MAESENKKPVKKRTGEKVSELDFKIKVLEGRESSLSESEVTRLNNLREMQDMQNNMGLNANKSVSINVLKKFTPPAKSAKVCKTSTTGGGEVNNTEKNKQSDNEEYKKLEDVKKNKKVHSYNNFVREMKKKQKIDKTGKTLNMEHVAEAWKSLLPNEKLKYRTLAIDVVGESSEITSEAKIERGKEVKRERDRNYQKAMAVRKKEKDIEKKDFCRDFEDILKEKENKVQIMREEKERISQEISKTVTENEIIQKMTADLVTDELALKSRLKLLFNHHKDCRTK